MFYQGRLRNLFLFVLLFFISTAVYCNSLNNPFMMDDDYLILQDTKLHNIQYWYYQFIPDLNKHLNLDYKETSAYYRPCAHILPMIGYYFFKDHVVGYHVMNLILFVLAGYFIFHLLNRLLKNEQIAFVTAILFLIHPINGLFVNYITASVFAVQMIFMALSIWFLLEAVQKSSKLAYAGSFILALLALLCHETALMLSGYMFLILWLNRKKTLLESLKLTLPFLLLAVVFFIFRLKFASLSTNILNKSSMLEMNAFEYLATLTKLILWYLSKIFFLNGIVIIWATPILREQLIIWIIVLAFLLGGLLYLLKFREKYSDIVLGFYIFAAGILPVAYACVFQPGNGLMIEPHWLFFPSIGLFWVIVTVIHHLEKKFLHKAGWIVLSVIMLILSLYTHRFNNVWGDERKYCAHWIQQVPHFKSAYFYLANAFMKHGEDELARENFLKAIEGAQNDWQIYNNLALLDEKKGDAEGVIQNYKKALTVSPQSVTVSNNLGLFLYKQSRTEEAINYFEHAIQYNRFFLEPRLNLAMIYQKENRYDAAEKLYQENLAINPNHSSTLTELMKMYMLQKNKPAIEKTCEFIFRNAQPDLILLVDLGGISAVQQDFPLAELFYSQAIKFYPRSALPYRELGKLYANTSQNAKAVEIWKIASKLDPQDQDVKRWIKELER